MPNSYIIHIEIDVANYINSKVNYYLFNHIFVHTMFSETPSEKTDFSTLLLNKSEVLKLNLYVLCGKKIALFIHNYSLITTTNRITL